MSYAMTISQYTLVCMSMYSCILHYDNFIIVHTGMYEFVHVQTRTDRFELSFKQLQTFLEPEIFCILSAGLTTALQMCNL
jgi:hypothetical protein